MAVWGVDVVVEDMVRAIVAADVVGVRDRDRDAKLVEMNGRSNVRVKVVDVAKAMGLFLSESSTAVRWWCWVPREAGMRGRLEVRRSACMSFVCLWMVNRAWMR